MLNLELQQDTRKQIQEIYKSISIHSIDNLNSRIECYDIVYPGVADRLLSAYYKCNDNRLNDLLDLCERGYTANKVLSVCTEMHRHKRKRARYNTGADNQKGEWHRRTPKDIPIIEQPISTDTPKMTNAPKEYNQSTKELVKKGASTPPGEKNEGT